MFKFSKKQKKEETKLTTLEQVRKAYEDLSEDDKKNFHQSISDRVHESVAAQERADGNKDSQSVEAREHEALGAEHAAGRGNVTELHERDDTAEEKREDRHEAVQDRKDNRQDERQDEAEAWRKDMNERMSAATISSTARRRSTVCRANPAVKTTAKRTRKRTLQNC